MEKKTNAEESLYYVNLEHPNDHKNPCKKVDEVRHTWWFYCTCSNGTIYKQKHAVDGRHPPTTWDGAKNLVNNGTNYQPQLVSLLDFWTLNSITLPCPVGMRQPPGAPAFDMWVVLGCPDPTNKTPCGGWFPFPNAQCMAYLQTFRVVLAQYWG